MTTFLRGPEAVYRFRLTRAATNFGVVVTGQPQGKSGRATCRRRPRREPPHRLCGSAGAPQSVPRRLPTAPVLAAAPSRRSRASTRSCSTARPLRAPGASRSASGSTTSPRRRCVLRDRVVRRGDPLRVAATDAGSGIYRQSIRAVGRRRQHLGVVRATESFAIPTVRPGAWQASTATACLRLPGDEEHRERRAHPPEHAHADGDLHRPLALRSGIGAESRAIRLRLLGLPVALLDRRERVQIALDALDELVALVVAAVTTRKDFFRRARSRSRRASAPNRFPRRGNSTATTSAAARTSTTSHGQLTRQILASYARKTCIGRVESGTPPSGVTSHVSCMYRQSSPFAAIACGCIENTMFSRELGLDALADLRELDHRHPDRVAGDVAEVVAALDESGRDRAVHVVAARSRPHRGLRRLGVLDVRLEHPLRVLRELGILGGDRARDLDPVHPRAGDLERGSRNFGRMPPRAARS